MPGIPDVKSRKDIEHLVDSFYARVEKSPIIGSLFANIDWPNHKPIMYSFWSSMILGDQTYKGNPFEKHVRLSLRAEQFKEWLRLFDQTVDPRIRWV